MPDHDNLNFFDPNKDIPAHHENQLTRAFLVVLRISPAAHQVWLSLAAPRHRLYELPRPWSFDTQRWKMFGSAPDVAEPIEGISVLQAADEQVVDGPVVITDRDMVLDGIVRYGDELLIVIETKLEAPSRLIKLSTLTFTGRTSASMARYKESPGSTCWPAGPI